MSSWRLGGGGGCGGEGRVGGGGGEIGGVARSVRPGDGTAAPARPESDGATPSAPPTRRRWRRAVARGHPTRPHPSPPHPIPMPSHPAPSHHEALLARPRGAHHLDLHVADAALQLLKHLRAPGSAGNAKWGEAKASGQGVLGSGERGRSRACGRARLTPPGARRPAASRGGTRGARRAQGKPQTLGAAHWGHAATP
jgi:hypothetical protein